MLCNNLFCFVLLFFAMYCNICIYDSRVKLNGERHAHLCSYVYEILDTMPVLAVFFCGRPKKHVSKLLRLKTNIGFQDRRV